MINRALYHIVILMVLLNTTYQVMAQDECSLKKNSDGIKVYSCKSDSESLNLIKAEFDLYASIDQYLNLARRIDNYKNWHYRAMKPVELKRNNENNIIYHTQISAPWPVRDRDLIIHLNMAVDEDGILTVVLKSLPEYLPEHEDFVRIPFSHSEMKMTPVSKNHTKVTYWIKANPGGSIPDWVTNMVSTQGPYETFKRMKEILESEPVTSSKKASNEAASRQR